MKRIYNIISGAAAIVSAAVLLGSCEEFTPVFTGQYPEPGEYETVTMEPTHTIAELAEMYRTGQPMEISEDIVIAGKVSTSDQAGNFYRSLYIQDETGGIELKLGKTGLYNDYKPGQTLYVKCRGLWLGMYGYRSPNSYGGGNGMVQLGCEDPTGEYETSYMEVQYLIDQHVLRGPFGDPVEPEVITGSQLPSESDTQSSNHYIGKLVTLEGLEYADEIFTLLYVNSNKDRDASSNRVFLSDDTFNITTWAMSEQNVKAHLQAGDWDDVNVGNGNDADTGVYGSVADHKDEMIRTASPANVSQYFRMPEGHEIQIRTSGYSRFADLEIDPEVLSGQKTINATGILTMYQGSIQFVLLDQTGIEVND